MAKIFYRNGIEEVVTSERLQNILQIKGIRKQVFTYKYL